MESRKNLVAFIRLRRYKEITVAELYARAGQVLLLPGAVMRAHDLAHSVGGDASAFVTINPHKRRKSAESAVVAVGGDALPKTAVVKSLQCTAMQGLFYHITDAVGSGDVVRVRAPSGEIIRLVKR